MRYNRELQAKDNVLPLPDRVHSKRNKQAAVSSDGKQLAPVKKRRRVVKAVKKEEDSPVKKEEKIEDDLQQCKDKPEDRKKPPAVVKKEEESPVKREEGIGDGLHQDKDEWEDRKKSPAAIKKEEEDEWEDDCKDDLHQDKDEREDSKKSPAAIKKEEEDQTEEKNICDDDQRDGDEPEDSQQASAAVKEEDEDKDEVDHQDLSSANTVKRKYSLRSLSRQNNNKSARPKPLGEDEESSTTLGEVNRSPMASSDEDEFGRGIESAADEASDTSDNVDGVIDHDEAILDRYGAQWNIMHNSLRAFKESHGHCELFRAVDRFTSFILNILTNTPSVALPQIQVKCHETSRKTSHWAHGYTSSV
jgi:hypothetical protein